MNHLLQLVSPGQIDEQHEQKSDRNPGKIGTDGKLGTNFAVRDETKAELTRCNISQRTKQKRYG